MTPVRCDSRLRSYARQYVDRFPDCHRRGRDDAAVVDLIRGNAYHQAGHAVVCCLLYGARVVKSASILPGAETLGEVIRFSALPIPLTWRPPLEGGQESIPPDALVDAEGVFAYAGVAAESLLADLDEGAAARPASESAKARAEAAGGDDRERLAEVARSLGRERPVEDFFEAYWEEARRLLSQNWDSVERVAAVLLEHGRLNGDRIDALVL